MPVLGFAFAQFERDNEYQIGLALALTEDAPMKALLVSLTFFVALLIPSSVLTAQVAGSGSMVAPGSIRGIEGKPFSADVINQLSRVLADGNRIDQETQGKMYRDSQGRIRGENEVFFSNGEKHLFISITDPSQGVTISLGPSRKTARINHHPIPGERPMPPPPPPPPVTAVPKQSHRSEQLGHMMIEGFDAVGTKWTDTVPANVIGNAQPLVSVTETWRSPELHEVLVVKNSDPQNGENVRKLVNIQRGEPDPALFQVPADYTVTDVPAPR